MLLGCILSFVFGLAAGVTLMCILAVSASVENDEYSKKLIEDIEEDKDSFTYDCLNDPEEDEHIPRIY